MHKTRVALFLSIAGICACAAMHEAHAQPAARGAIYFPGPGGRWERRSPGRVGMDSARIALAVAYAIANETKASRDLLLAHVESFGREPFGDAIGPFKARGDPTGLIIRRGYVVAEWGDPRRVDMTFSVTK